MRNLFVTGGAGFIGSLLWFMPQNNIILNLASPLGGIASCLFLITQALEKETAKYDQEHESKWIQYGLAKPRHAESRDETHHHHGFWACWVQPESARLFIWGCCWTCFREACADCTVWRRARLP